MDATPGAGSDAAPIDLPPPVDDREIRRRRRSLAFAAFIVVPFVPLDLAHPGGEGVAWASLPWAAALLAGAALQRPGRPRASAAGVYLAALGASAAALAKVYFGGSSSPVAMLPFALPLGSLIFVPGLPGAAVLSALVGLAGGSAVRWLEGRPGPEIAYAAAIGGAVALVAALAGAGVRRHHREELRHAALRTETLRALAESEIRLANALRQAEAGRIAAAVAHEVMNPLSAVRANLGWLRDHLAGRGARDVEVEAALRETQESAARIEKTVGRLREVPREPAERDPFAA